MRHVLALLLSIVFLFVLGCSGGTPTTPTGASDSKPSSDNLDYQVLSAGVMNLETGTVEPDREAEGYLNVTSLVGSNFHYTINGWSSPGVLDITLSLNNASSLTVNDVYIVFEELTGKKVMNQDGMIDIYGPTDLDPFIAFRKESPTRAFPPGLDTEKLLLTYPGSGIYVSYFIIAHLGGNTGGVWNLTDWTATGDLLPSGGSADVTVKVWDWQNDVTSVVADTTVLTGGFKTFVKSATPQIWGATVVNSAHAPVGDYSILVRAQSPASPTYSYYSRFTLEVVNEGTAHVSPVANITKPAEDTWFDIGVAEDGPVYVVADHPATGNTGGQEDTGTRTAIRFDNLLGNMTVINAGGTGMSQANTGVGWGEYEFNRIDVTPNGSVVTNFAGARIVPWSIAGATATIGTCCYAVSCGINGTLEDVTDYNDEPSIYGTGMTGIGMMNDSCDPGNWSLGFNEDNLFAALPNGNWSVTGAWLWPERFGVKGVDHIAGTGNLLVFYTSATEGYCVTVGDAFSGVDTGVYNMDVVSTFGSFGTADGQFKGGLDVAIDNDGAILTLEDHGGGVYRFQKFGPDFMWIYSSTWEEATQPMRMDYDKADNMLYLLTNQGISICSVD